MGAAALAAAGAPASSAATTTAVSDAFQRTVASGWGSAPTGGAYAFADASGAASSSVARVGLMTATGARQAPQQTLPAARTAASTSTLLVFALDRRPTGADAEVLAVARAQGTGDAAAYRVGVDVAPSGAATLEALAVAAGGSASPLAVAPVLVLAPGKRYKLRVAVSAAVGGTTLQARAWPASQSEPSAWQLSALDASGPQQAGAPGVRLAVGSISNAPLTLRVWNLKVTNAAAARDTTPPSAPPRFTATGVGSSAVATSWGASSDPDSTVAGYELSLDGVQVATTKGTSYTFTGLSPGTGYSLAVAAVDPSGNRSDASLLAVTTTQASAFADPCGQGGASPPASYRHVIWIWMENQPSSLLANAATAPYLSQLAAECGSATRWMDDLFPFDSEPEYEAAVSGSNCDVGFGSTGSNCNTGNDGPPATSVVLSNPTIFDQLTAAGGSWRAYEEGMDVACGFQSVTATHYVPKHNPPVFFATLTGGSHTAPAAGSACVADDLPIPALTCAPLANAPCTGTASGAFAEDLAGGTLPTFSIVTPNTCNDMHSCSPSAADNWLQAWMPLIAASPAYRSGTTAVLLLWDEGTFGQPQPGVVIAPWLDHVSVSTPLDNLTVLAASESMLGLPGRLGCAGGTPPGDVGRCPAASDADLRALFGL